MPISRIVLPTWAGSIFFQKKEGLNSDCIENSREMKGRKIKNNKNQKDWSIKKNKGASRRANVQIMHRFTKYFAYLLCSPNAARRHSEAHSTRKVRFLLNTMKHRFARMCFLLERGVHLDKLAILMHIRTKTGRKVKMLKNDGFYQYFFKLLSG